MEKLTNEGLMTLHILFIDGCYTVYYKKTKKRKINVAKNKKILKIKSNNNNSLIVLYSVCGFCSLY